MSKDFNIAIGGIGGQGVYTLTEALMYSFSHSACFPKCSIYKGGAQRRGSITAMIRIFHEEEKAQLYSSDILKGSLDFILGMEPHEALRLSTKAHKDTRLISDKTERDFQAEKETPRPVLETLEALPIQVELFDFSSLAIEQYGNEKMANYIAGVHLIKQLPVAISADFKHYFTKKGLTHGT